MSTLLFAGVGLGYGLRWLHESYQRRQRERVLRALGGDLPDWERAARSLEDAAHDWAMRVQGRTAAELRYEADITRRRGRRRDREWT